MMRTRTWRASGVALLVVGLTVLGGSPALADGDPLGGLTNTVENTLKPVTDAVSGASGAAGTAGAPGGAGGSTPAPSGSGSTGSGSSSSGSSTTGGGSTPSEPDHAGGQALHTGAGGQDLADVGGATSTVNDDDSTKADSSALTLGGMEVAGAHADSTGQQDDSFEGANQVTDPACESSAGQACFGVLFADAHASDDGTTSDSSSDSGVLSGCLGGTESAGGCDAPVDATLLGSGTETTRDQRTGRTRAASDSEVANLCLTAPTGLPGLPGLPEPPALPTGPLPELPSSPLPGLPGLPSLPTLPIPGSGTPGCAVGVAALSSTGQADSGGSSPSAHKETRLAGLTLAGTTYDEGTLGLPSGQNCASTLACVATDTGETIVGPGSLAGTVADALDVQLLPDLIPGLANLVEVGAGHTETLVHNDGGEAAPGAPRPPTVAGVEATSPSGTSAAAAHVAGDASGLLPNTGGVPSSLLATGLLALGAGSLLMAESRRRRLAVALA